MLWFTFWPLWIFSHPSHCLIGGMKQLSHIPVIKVFLIKVYFPLFITFRYCIMLLFFRDKNNIIVMKVVLSCWKILFSNKKKNHFILTCLYSFSHLFWTFFNLFVENLIFLVTFSLYCTWFLLCCISQINITWFKNKLKNSPI
jgi:hypothetical protein